MWCNIMRYLSVDSSVVECSFVACVTVIHLFLFTSVFSTGASCYMHFCHLNFHISASLFQYHEEHQYPIHSHSRSCCAGSLNCTHSFTHIPHPFESRDYKLRPVIAYHCDNPETCYIFAVLCIFSMCSNSCVMRVIYTVDFDFNIDGS
jgi:hypothetical protein